MRLTLLYLLTFLFAFILLESGCGGDNISNPTPNVPEGTFSGKFSLYHLHDKSGVVDTQTAVVNLNIETSTGFKVTGDTSTVHAGSYGSFVVNSNYTEIDFVDKTYPTTGTPAKVHLNGIYNYSFNGTTLQMVTTSAYDTLTYVYNLTRTGN
jgi:hypothetical protein